MVAQFGQGEPRLVASLEHLSNLDRQPDALVLTGDLVDRGLASEYRRLRQVLDPCPIPWFVLPGNHDNQDEFRLAFADRADEFADDHLSWVVDDLPLRIVGLDTTIRDRDDGEVDEARLGWLAATLETDMQRPTILFMHHPPFATGMWWMDYGGVRGSAELRDLLSRHPQVLRVQCGHVHREIQTSWEHAVVATAPAVSYQSAIGLTDESPPVLSDEPSGTPMLLWENGTLLYMKTDVPGRWTSVDLRGVISDWDSYQRAAKYGGPMPQERAH